MGTFIDTVTRTGGTVLDLLRRFSFKDAIDVAIVTLLLYALIKLVRDTRAGQLVKGIILLVALYLLSFYGDLLMLNSILRAFLQSTVIMVVILFQPEIRKALEQVGHSKAVQSITSNLGGKSRDGAETRAAIEGVVEATAILQQLRMGALIVFERQTKLGEIISTGTLVDAGPSGQLIANIFFNKAPLHDGGMIIRGGRVCAAGCILPLTASDSVSAELGTRHRAAIGMSENSDAVVVVVSEETGQISIAVGGKLTRNYNRVTLSETLFAELIGAEGVAQGNGLLGRLGLNKGKKEGR
ncbi:TIGR00159 family protein [Acutalibacter muris]|jgi:diadenylate cyclase|uniref:Diadenylate cyclase n=1 Tax=Acutalibacter muris TaxID=1796620 RepID=A0A1Z2XMK2_9FIRM|nr:diadenylate cyclase CdaA [Acutalibacter muris]ANU53651.1 TIGR00159 family protein [Hungateiclostridiaceae bacterium KB18]ASB39674.1 TIGR00159 family protein [Acutalibacter muris]QQR28968.1 TIGR00159 family protein [Acutalibacter muris]